MRSKVEFLSCNLINPKAVDTVISDQETWDLVFNCAGETRPGQDDQVYKVSACDPRKMVLRMGELWAEWETAKGVQKAQVRTVSSLNDFSTAILDHKSKSNSELS